MLRVFPVIVASLTIALLVGACGNDSGAARRSVAITQRDDSCEPKSFSVAAGEKVVLTVTNEGKRDQEIEGIEGTKLEEVLVPAGKTRKINYTAPKSATVLKFKCYAPNGQTTVIEASVGSTPVGTAPVGSK